MNKYIVLLTILLSLSSISCFRGAHRENRVEKSLIKKLSLNQTQQTVLATAIKEYNVLFFDSKKMMQKIKESIKLEVQKEQVDFDEVVRVLQQQLSEFSDLIPEYIAIFSEFHAELTLQQREELAELIDKRFYRRHYRGRDKNEHKNRNKSDKGNY